MPDVKVFTKDDITTDRNLYKSVRRTVAGNLSCEECDVRPEQVDVMIIRVVNGEQYTPASIHAIELYSNADVLIEICGYAHTSRMANIDERIAAIAARVKQLLGLQEEQRVCITYFVVQDRCWVAV
jgi:hypothetical protein